MRFLRTLVVIALLGATATGTTRFVANRTGDAAVSPAASRNLRADLSALLEADLMAGNPTADERRHVHDFYSAATPVWMDDGGQLSAAGRQAMELLASADSHGLDPAHYQVQADPSDGVSFEVALTLSMLRYLGDISTGRITPSSLGYHLPPKADRAALAPLLREHAMAGRTAAAVSEIMPAVGNYEGVRRALATYRAMAAQPEPEPLPTVAKSIHADEPLPWAPALRARLKTFGDLPQAISEENATAADDTYSPALVAGVTSFQQRHGLLDDGVLGNNTIAALNVPVATRVRQLEMALERLRWLRRDLDGPVILVNIPMFRLSAWDDVRASAPAMTMKVVVGTAGRNATPIMTAEVERVVFRPYWNVPRSIVLGELLPKAKADPGYLTAHHYEIVRGLSDRGEVVPVTPDSLQELERGALRLRQRPGTFNALGLVKFDFPNRHDVFLHDTPTQSAFQRDRRALSHGCVRVERPVDLASWVLGTSTDAVHQAIARGQTHSTRVPQPVHVLLTYATAAVDADGTVRFASDIYKHDGRLDAALR